VVIKDIGEVMVNLQYDGKKRYHLTIPKHFVELLGWKKGQRLAVYPAGEGKERQLLVKEMPKKK
jgi:bifunctional DNA-binding transcriptional regulator/antitoxin component of YhaV-PrlF toxin-antitoxin module